MPAVWQKRYGFRLRECDQELITLLEEIPPAKKSEVIRQLLRFAYRTLTEQKEKDQQIRRLSEDIHRLREAQDHQFQKLYELLLQGTRDGERTVTKNKENNIRMGDEVVKQSAEALLASFGQQDR